MGKYKEKISNKSKLILQWHTLYQDVSNFLW